MEAIGEDMQRRLGRVHASQFRLRTVKNRRGACRPVHESGLIISKVESGVELSKRLFFEDDVYELIC